MLHNYEETENYLENEQQVNAMHLKQLNRDYDKSACLIERAEIKMNISLAEETENYLENERQVNAMHLKQINRDYAEIQLNISLAEEEQMRINLILFNGGY